MSRTAAAAAAAGLAALFALPGHAGAAAPNAIRSGGPSSPADPKVAVVATRTRVAGRRFTVVDAGGRRVLSGRLRKAAGSPSPWRHAATADLSRLRAPGRYRVRAAGLTSRPWIVAANARSALVRRLLRIFAANADGAEPNPVFGPAHMEDAIVKGGPLDGRRVDLTGGWRDAGDNLKFAQTTAFAVSYLSLAARLDPADAPLLRQTAETGVRWLLKLNPAPGVFVELVGDERDHGGFRDPAKDDADERPGVGVRFAYPNTSANVLGGVTAALALAAQGAQGERRDQLVAAARTWFDAGRAANRVAKLGDPNTRDYYPDVNFREDLAFAAIELYHATGDLDLAGLAGDLLAASDDEQYFGGTVPGAIAPIVAAELCGGLGAPAVPIPGDRETGCKGLRAVVEAGRERLRATAFATPGIFTFGFTQDNGGAGAVAAAAARAGVARDGKRIAAAARDYLLGRNPWGRSFVVGSGAVDARNPHHPAYLKGSPARLLDGAVVNGPARLEELRDNGLRLSRTPLRRFNSRTVFYEDVRDDYITSEPSLAVSASSLLLAASLP